MCDRLIQGSALFQQEGNATHPVTGLQKGPSVSQVGKTPEQCLGSGSKVNAPGPLPDQLGTLRSGYGPTSERQYSLDGFFGQNGFQGFLFKLPEGRLATLGKDFKNGLAGTLPDYFVQIPERNAEPQGEGAPYAALAAAHHSGQSNQHRSRFTY